MHHHGGMYADLDMEALRDLTPLLEVNIQATVTLL